MRSRALVLAAAAAAALAAAGCSSSRTIIPYSGPDGKPIPFAFRHEMRAKDSDSREPIEGALVGVKSSEDQVWQVDFTGKNGGASLSQEYAEATVYLDQRSFFFVNTENTIRLRAPGFQMAVRHPSYDGFDTGYGAGQFLDRPREADGFHYAELVRPRLCPLDRREGVPKGDDPLPVPRPRLADVVALGGPRLVGQKEGHASAGFSVGPAVHGGRFTRVTGPTGAPERAARVYHIAESGVAVILAPVDPADAGAPGTLLPRVLDLCDTADLALHAADAPLEGARLSNRWVRADRDGGASAEARLAVAIAALDGALGAGAKSAALVYPPALAASLDEKLRARGFELLAEWWWR